MLSAVRATAELRHGGAHLVVVRVGALGRDHLVESTITSNTNATITIHTNTITIIILHTNTNTILILIQ